MPSPTRAAARRSTTGGAWPPGPWGSSWPTTCPTGVRSLANILTRGLIDGVMTVFHRRYRSQDGSVVSDGNRWLSPEDVLLMDWLLDCVDGSIPGYDELLPMARPIVRLQGVYRDSIPPEKGGSTVKLLLLSDVESPYLWDY